MNQSVKPFARTSFNNAAGKSAYILFAALLIFASFSTAFAGGFQLAVEAPPSSGSHSKDAALLVRTYGCHTPADANVTATAEGIVNGRRQSIPLELKPDATGVYEIKQQWPAEGTWMLSFTGAYNGMTCTVFVDLGPNGKVYPDTKIESWRKTGAHARAFNRKPTSEDIESALKSLTSGVGLSIPDSAPRTGTLVAGGAGAFLFLVGITALTKRARSNHSKE
ncbi:MAG TPA: hypothetical protein VJZ26_09230 [Blastocatellia bacterium]|nr:hypothetical protein [Blastocatellia bacterium]